MEKEKYYTPSIEEFHVNSEYEVLENDSWIKKNDFTNAYDYEDSCLYGLIKDLQKGNIRVKYLDREDIESFGFKYAGNDMFDILDFKEPRQHYDTIHLVKRRNWVLISMGRKQDDVNDFATIFCGFIKNKSELSRLLKQLSII